jgi:hypothetical protein
MQRVCREAGYYNQLHAGRAAKDIPRLLRHPKVHGRSHQSPPLDYFQPTQSQPAYDINCACNIHHQCLSLVNGLFISVFRDYNFNVFLIKINKKELISLIVRAE